MKKENKIRMKGVKLNKGWRRGPGPGTIDFSGLVVAHKHINGVTIEIKMYQKNNCAIEAHGRGSRGEYLYGTSGGFWIKGIQAAMNKADKNTADLIKQVKGAYYVHCD